MKNKKIFIIIIGIIICIVIGVCISKWLKQNKVETTTEITPKEEMTEEQERQTIISLYYTNIETNTLIPEARVIDAKNLLENPYKTLVEYLIENPKNDKLKSSIPEGTKVNNAEFSGEALTIDLSKEFIENQNEETISLAVNAIVNTLTELNEVNSVKFLIDGAENDKAISENIKLNQIFSRNQ